MSEVTVKQLSEVVGTPVDRLLVQLSDAGLSKSGPDDAISDEEKLQLLNHLRRAHGKDEGAGTVAPQKITLRRKRVSELKLGGAGRKTVNVEVRGRRTYVKRTVTPETEAAAETKAPESTTASAAAQTAPTPPAAPVETVMEDVEAIAQREAHAKAEAAEREREEAAQREAQERQAEEEVAEARRQFVAEEMRKAEAEARSKAEEEEQALRRAAEEEARRQAEAASAKQVRTEKTSRSGPAERGRGGERPGAPTRYGRNELHVAAGKNRRKKKTKSAQRGSAVSFEAKHGFERPTAPMVREIRVPETITVAELANLLAVKAAELIKVMMRSGVMATINQVLDQETAILVVEEMGHRAVAAASDDLEAQLSEVVDETGRGDLQSRPPVVTVMGHVDHGKTSLLDHIRRTRVAAGEAGGITQHIGAYHVETEKGVVTFLDTPGHAAFTAMRARGAQSTDIVVLVVAADDGVMPQTVEAVQHARAAKVPLVVAINKVDKPDSDPDRVKNELAQKDVIPEEWGGDTMFVNVSAHTGEGIDDLLDGILLQAEVLELKAHTEGQASGVVIEASLDKGRGPIATVLVQQGQLNKGDFLLAGTEYGRIRALFDENGQAVPSAGPSMPVVVLGLSGTPNAGEDVLVVENERKAREVALFRQGKYRDVRLAAKGPTKLEDIFSQVKDGEQQSVNLVVKADVQGSFEAIRDSLEKLSSDEVAVRIIGGGVGGITESDVNLAAASGAILIGFNTRADSAARRLVSDQDVDLHYYSVIYDVIDQVKGAINGMLSPDIEERIIGLAEVRDVFKSPKFGAVAGCIVVDGSVRRHQPIRVLRDHVVIYEGELESLRRFKDDVDEVRMGTECGIAVKNYNDVRVGDHIEVYERKEVARTI